MSRGSVGILGGGISGVALAAHLKRDLEVLEKAPRPGGLCASVTEGGFTFDAAGPHIMFSKNKAILALMVEVLGDNVHQARRDNKIWFKGHFVKYPFENGLGDLPKQDCFECIRDYLQNPWTKTPENLEEWAYATFGASISDKYFLPYNAKIWKIPPSEIALQWVSRIPKPPLEDVLKSAIGISTEGYVHQLHFFYPLRGGYESLVDGFARRVTRGPVRTGTEVLAVDREGSGWRVETSDGARRYERLVSTLPVHELARVWSGFPDAAREALSKLRYNHLVNVCLGLGEDRGFPYTALYVPDPDRLTHRVSFPKAFSPHTVPAGKSSVMAEITSIRGDRVWQLSDDEILARTVADLSDMDLISPGAVEMSRVLRFEYGYPVIDHAYHDAVKALCAAVEAEGIRLLGRFAQFEYINSDVCVERAVALAGELDDEA